MSDDRATEIMNRQHKMYSDRLQWVRSWEEISEVLLPRYVNRFRSPLDMIRQGQQNTEKQFDATPALALDKFSAAMDSMLTPRLQKWHRLRASVPSLNKSARVRIYFDEVRDILFKYRYAPNANFASQMFEHWQGLGAFGTAATFVDRMAGGGLRYRSIFLGEIYFLENHQGLVDTAHRVFKLTARQAMQKWGEKCPDKIKAAAADPKKQDDSFTFIHCVYPNTDYTVGRMDNQGMEFRSDYVCEDTKTIVEEGGYATFPYAISRYVTGPGETYGRSPAMTVLPNIKVLNEQKKTMLKMGQRAVDPVLLAHDDGVIGTVNLTPGYVNYGGIDSQGRKLVTALEMPNSGQGLNVGKEMVADERAIVNDAFWITIFQILTETPQMTATEVLERVKEKGALLAPIMGRQQSECLGPLIERELDLLNRQHLLPPMPPELVEAGGEFHVIYDSPLSRAMQAEEASGFMRTLETAINYSQATQDPSAFDWLDIDTAMPEIADIQAVPARWVRTPDAVAKIREGRSQAQQQQQMADAAPAIASILKTTGSAVPGGQ